MLFLVLTPAAFVVFRMDVRLPILKSQAMPCMVSTSTALIQPAVGPVLNFVTAASVRNQ
jgi:hypothetical protein